MQAIDHFKSVCLEKGRGRPRVVAAPPGTSEKGIGRGRVSHWHRRERFREAFFFVLRWSFFVAAVEGKFASARQRKFFFLMHQDSAESETRDERGDRASELGRVRLMGCGIIRMAVVHTLLPDVKLDGCWRRIAWLGRADNGAVRRHQRVTMLLIYFLF
jgi:hypothetical protein